MTTVKDHPGHRIHLRPSPPLRREPVRNHGARHVQHHRLARLQVIGGPGRLSRRAWPSRPGEVGPHRADVAGRGEAVGAAARQGVGRGHGVEHQGDVAGVHGPQLDVGPVHPAVRAVGEVVDIGRGPALGGLSLGGDHRAGAHGVVAGRGQVDVAGRRAGTVGAIGVDQGLGLVAEPARQPRLQPRLVQPEGLDVLAGPGEERRLAVQPADHQRLVGGAGRGRRVERVMRQQVAVEDRAIGSGRQRLDPAPAAAVALDLGVQRLLGGQDPGRGHVEHLAPVGRGDLQLLQEHPRRLGGDVGRRDPHHRPALDDRPGKQRRDRRHGVEARGLGPAAGLAEDRHIGRIAAERRDIARHPLQGQHDVRQALVARAGVVGPAQLAQVQIAQHAQPMVGGHHHHVVLAGQHRTVLRRAAAGTGRVAAAMAVDHHRPALAAAGRGPDVQHQAVLARRGLVEPIDRGRILQRRRPQPGGVPHPGPGRDRLGRLEAGGARDAGPVRHALVGVDAARPQAAQPALGDLDLDGF
jgi:hypothetical protein